MGDPVRQLAVGSGVGDCLRSVAMVEVVIQHASPLIQGLLHRMLEEVGRQVGDRAPLAIAAFQEMGVGDVGNRDRDAPGFSSPKLAVGGKPAVVATPCRWDSACHGDRRSRWRGEGMLVNPSWDCGLPGQDQGNLDTHTRLAWIGDFSPLRSSAFLPSPCRFSEKAVSLRRPIPF